MQGKKYAPDLLVKDIKPEDFNAVIFVGRTGVNVKDQNSIFLAQVSIKIINLFVQSVLLHIFLQMRDY